MIELGPLPGAQVAELVGGLVGGRPGQHLTDLMNRAGGNPLYARELADGLVRDGQDPRDAVRPLLEVSTRSGATPSMWAMTRDGIGKPRSPMMSIWSWPLTRSSASSTTRCVKDSSMAMLRGTKARETSLRNRVCAGGSLNTIQSVKNRRTACTSWYRVTKHMPICSCQYNGSFSRINAKVCTAR